MVYTTLDSAREFLNVPAGEVTGIEVRIEDLRDAESVGGAVEFAVESAAELAEVHTWMELNERLFSALELEQFVIGLLLMFIVLVASFATVCVLTMIVIQRSDEIAIMRSMGASAGSIRKIFVVQGMSIGISGIIMGLIIGLGLVAYLQYVGVALDPSVYYIDRVPVELAGADVLRVTLGVLAISAFATLLPSLQASRLDPADALRHD
ncbi:MAG: lipoprotein-releasing system permease protein [Bradymonadia bacterium]|jgi:lipoprotein-releasing system permease protein